MRYDLEAMLPEQAFQPRNGMYGGMTLEGGGGASRRAAQERAAQEAAAAAAAQRAAQEAAARQAAEEAAAAQRAYEAAASQRAAEEAAARQAAQDQAAARQAAAEQAARNNIPDALITPQVDQTPWLSKQVDMPSFGATNQAFLKPYNWSGWGKHEGPGKFDPNIFVDHLMSQPTNTAQTTGTSPQMAQYVPQTFPQRTPSEYTPTAIFGASGQKTMPAVTTPVMPASGPITAPVAP